MAITKEQALDAATKRIATNARATLVNAVKAEARAFEYRPQSRDLRSDLRNLQTRIGEVESQYQYMQRAGIKGLYTYDFNLMLALAGQRLALRYRKMKFYPELSRETEDA